MEIGSLLSKVFENTTIDLNVGNEIINRSIQFHYGDSKELAKWIFEHKNTLKYPLIWYVVVPVDDEGDTKVVTTQLIIFQSTQIGWLNDTRSIKSYDAIISPVYELMKKKLLRHRNISVLNEPNKQFTYKDEPNYGVATEGLRTSQTDFISKETKGDESITIDVVDARIVEIKLRINTNCIKL